MSEAKRILIADDEEIFRESTADLLRENGYRVDCAVDADSAEALLKKDSYDILISDINMPGNTKLEFIKALAQREHLVPVILVTGYPSVETASQSVQLPVIAYLLKPLDLDELLRWVEFGVGIEDSLTSMANIRFRLSEWDAELQGLEETMQSLPKDVPNTNVEAFIDNSFNNLSATLLDMKSLILASVGARKQQSACHLLNCPRYQDLQDHIREAIDVLGRTKTSFKSKELGDLRKKLEQVIGGDENIKALHLIADNES